MRFPLAVDSEDTGFRYGNDGDDQRRFSLFGYVIAGARVPAASDP
jgi:hypothetical protein